MGVINLYRVKLAAVLAKKLQKLWTRAPQLAKNAQAGRFAILWIDRDCGQIPLSISAVKGDRVRFNFIALGKVSGQRGVSRRGDSIRDMPQSLGNPGKIAKIGTRAARGGGLE